MKLTILTNILAPYRIPLFEEIKNRVERLDVVVMASAESQRQWKISDYTFMTHVLPGIHFRLPGYPFSVHVNYGVRQLLHKLAPEIIISGGFAPANIAGYLYARHAGKRHFPWGELHDQDIAKSSSLKRFIRHKLIAGSTGAIASSTRACKVFTHYGMAKDRVLTSVMPIDVEGFSRNAQAFRGSEEMRIMQQRYSSPLLLSIGRLTDSKGYWELFKIFEQLLERYPTAGLLIVGDGPQRPVYEHYCQSKGWQNVNFQGFLDPAQLIKFMVVADLFVFHTLRDPFGAVVPEAMAAGVPVLSSIHAGATDDLIEEGVTGFRFDPRNYSDAVCRVSGILSLPAEGRRQLIVNAFQRVQRHTFAKEAAAIVAFVSKIELPV